MLRDNSVIRSDFCSLCRRPFDLMSTNGDCSSSSFVLSSTHTSTLTNQNTLSTCDDDDSFTTEKMDKVYFSILHQQNLLLSSPGTIGADSDNVDGDFSNSSHQNQKSPSHQNIPSNTINQGYYERFFKEEKLLGRGARGTVHLTTHILQGEMLGMFAVKKIPVGDDVQWLLRTIKEVHVLEGLHHPNLVSYRHSWVEVYQPTQMGPPVPGLFILMQYANCGDLSTLVEDFGGDGADGGGGTNNGITEETKITKERKIVIHIMKGCALGLQYLHRKNIVHGDIKPANILITKDDGINFDALISDFGECKEDSTSTNTPASTPLPRTGHTGTIEYCAPELYRRDVGGSLLVRPSAKTDIWSLGMVFFYLLSHGSLPLSQIDDFDVLLDELCKLDCISFKSIPEHYGDLRLIIEKMLLIDPEQRLTIHEVVDLLLELPGNSDSADADDSVFSHACNEKRTILITTLTNIKTNICNIGLAILFVVNLTICYPMAPSIAVVVGWVSLLILLRLKYVQLSVSVYVFICLLVIGGILWYKGAICAI